MIRQAEGYDIPGIVDLGMRALEENPYQGLLPSRRKCYQVAKDAIEDKGDFAWVAEHGGEVTGSLIACAHPMIFHERKQASVVQFYCTGERAGLDMRALLVALNDWADGRSAVRSIVFTMEHTYDPRLGKLLERLGYQIELPIYMRVK